MTDDAQQRIPIEDVRKAVEEARGQAALAHRAGDPKADAAYKRLAKLGARVGYFEANEKSGVMLLPEDYGAHDVIRALDKAGVPEDPVAGERVRLQNRAAGNDAGLGRLGRALDDEAERKAHDRGDGRAR
jgi:hypothetical protein